jgi:hypothetical protein
MADYFKILDWRLQILDYKFPQRDAIGTDFRF